MQHFCVIVTFMGKDKQKIGKQEKGEGEFYELARAVMNDRLENSVSAVKFLANSKARKHGRPDYEIIVDDDLIDLATKIMASEEDCSKAAIAYSKTQFDDSYHYCAFHVSKTTNPSGKDKLRFLFVDSLGAESELALKFAQKIGRLPICDDIRVYYSINRQQRKGRPGCADFAVNYANAMAVHINMDDHYSKLDSLLTEPSYPAFPSAYCIQGHQLPARLLKLTQFPKKLQTPEYKELLKDGVTRKGEDQSLRRYLVRYTKDGKEPATLVKAEKGLTRCAALLAQRAKEEDARRQQS